MFKEFLMSTASNGDGSATGSMLRIPFEATVEPEKYFSSVPLVDMCVHPSSSMDITSSWGGSGDDVYKMRAHNALASIIEFFLPGKNNKGELEELSFRTKTDDNNVQHAINLGPTNIRPSGRLRVVANSRSARLKTHWRTG